MKLYNIKAHFNLDSSLDDSVLENFTKKYTRHIFRGFGAILTVYNSNNIYFKTKGPIIRQRKCYP